jgi:phosphatidylcholine synthase
VLRFYNDVTASTKHKSSTASAQPYQAPPESRVRTLFAWGVHAYTALSSVAAFAGVLAVISRDYRTAFIWMIVATVLDATDGVLARLARVREILPNVDGARLDDIVDYLTYVFLPVLLLYQAGDIPRGPIGLVVAAAVLLSSAYGFASLDAKTDDYFFTGFPSYWNIVALYLHVAGLSPVVNAVVLGVFVGLVFVRTGYVYPSRTPVLRRLTLALGVIWAVMIVSVVVLLPDVPRWLWIGSLFFPVYYFMLSLALQARRRTA